MKKILVFLISALLTCTGLASAGEKAHWGYSGHEGPEHWGELSKEYEICGSGKNQSPVNLTGMIESDLEDIKFNYGSTPIKVVNNGHSIQVDYAKGSSIEIDGTTFNLLQYHFHTPSENNIEGKSFPMEAHLVHADKDGNLAVVAVMFEKGSANPVVSTTWEHMPANAGETASPAGVTVNVMEMLPKSKDYYRFNGSLTTPPCTEGVRWFVLKNAAEASEEQIEKFHATFHHDTNRPVQPLYARPVLK